ncbi:MAG TPA: cupin domain-containing protein [Puia sp.]|nr:cupin domain-containing protein [Puia sp.]
MFRHLILFLFAAAGTLTANAQSEADTLTAGVFAPNPTVLQGATRDLASLDIRLITIRPNKTFRLPEHDSSDHLFIVRNGSIAIATDPAGKTLGPGGIGLFGSHIPPVINKTKTNSTFYLLSFRSRTGADPHRGSAAFLRDWPELVMKKTPKGESRAIFSQPTTWLKNINMHATTLNPGEISHPQHMHRAEEILLLRSGNVRMHIGNGYIPAKGGDLVFLPSGVPHDLENGNTGRTEYFALQWEQ